ncbi:Holliday junction resolvase RecU [Mycoplasmopsis iners]|uniref:Holliday junction resolvase RecU n=1 Tax=Mycoplasmopsis iners TaxID=76630 RepID=UPI0004951865|nr:Holliday junction resolvase RecU [Mycoplasmopsis iners]
MKNRGMLLENIINRTIEYYKQNKLAYIEKKSLPIKFKSVGQKLNLEQAFISNKSTVDYIGCWQGSFIAFEAKSTQEDSLPKDNIKAHQIEYLDLIEQNGGIAFFIVFFSSKDEFYLVEFSLIKPHLNKAIKYEMIKKIGKSLELTFPGIIDFLPYL